MLKVVNLGLPKTGTTTLARALRRAGLHVADHRIRRRQTSVPEHQNAFVADLLYEGLFKTGDPAHCFDAFEAISEMSLLREGRSLWPQMDYAIIEGLRRHHPDMRFLASSRDPFALSQSMLAWSDLGSARLPAASIPGLPPGFGETSKERMQWITSHYDHLQDLFSGRSDFLMYDIADAEAPAKIEAFLDLKLPWWGRANANSLLQEIS